MSPEDLAKFEKRRAFDKTVIGTALIRYTNASVRANQLADNDRASYARIRLACDAETAALEDLIEKIEALQAKAGATT